MLPDIKDKLNKHVKHREMFRPFAPAILHEKGSEWFENYDYSPYMNRIFKYKDGKGLQVPAVNHIDDTGRLQSVTEEDNPLFNRLIEYFENLSGVPILLNTSFNNNEPIVETPDDAISTFDKTGIDVLVLKNLYVTKQ